MLEMDKDKTLLEKDIKGVSESQNNIKKQDFVLICPAHDILRKLVVSSTICRLGSIPA
jgi:hypothetical protein